MAKATNKKSVIESLKINNIEKLNKKIIANTMSTYFASIGFSYAQKIPSSNKSIDEYLNNITRHEKSIYMSPMNPLEVHRIIDSLKSKSSSGWDNISNKLLKKNV